VNQPLGQKLVVDVAGTLEFFIDPAQGQPSAATITIKAPDGAALPAAVSGAAMTVDSVSTTLSADPARGATSVTLTAATSVAVGRSYVIETDGQRELVVVRAINTSTKVATLADELEIDHASASTFKGIRMTYAVAGTQQATADRNYLATLAWTDEDSVARTGSFVYHVVYWPWTLPTTRENVLRSWADANLQEMLRDVGTGFSGVLAAAADDLALEYLRPSGYVEDQFPDRAPFIPLHVALVRRNLIGRLYPHDVTRLTELTEHWQVRCDALADALLRQLPAYDDDNDGIIDSGSEEDIRERSGFIAPSGWQSANPGGVDSDNFEPEFVKIGTAETNRTNW